MQLICTITSEVTDPHGKVVSPKLGLSDSKDNRLVVLPKIDDRSTGIREVPNIYFSKM